VILPSECCTLDGGAIPTLLKKNILGLKMISESATTRLLQPVYEKSEHRQIYETKFIITERKVVFNIGGSRRTVALWFYILFFDHCFI
jgi:hypothetical protein